jgi:hypothetical protein
MSSQEDARMRLDSRRREALAQEETETDVRSRKEDARPRRLSGFISMMGRGHQALLVLLSVFLFVVGILPLEVQRRIVNGATQGATLNTILVLVLTYLALVLSEAGIKLVLNVYRGWIGEVSIRWLRMAVIDARERHPRLWRKASKCRSCSRRQNPSVGLSAPVYLSRYSRQASSWQLAAT